MLLRGEVVEDVQDRTLSLREPLLLATEVLQDVENRPDVSRVALPGIVAYRADGLLAQGSTGTSRFRSWISRLRSIILSSRPIVSF